MHHEGQETPPRKLVWVEGVQLAGWGCSNCAWVFHPSTFPSGKSLYELTAHAQRQLDEEFASHGCAAHPRSEAAAS
jgi:rubredoxin